MIKRRVYLDCEYFVGGFRLRCGLVVSSSTSTCCGASVCWGRGSGIDSKVAVESVSEGWRRSSEPSNVRGFLEGVDVVVGLCCSIDRLVEAEPVVGMGARVSSQFGFKRDRVIQTAWYEAGWFCVWCLFGEWCCVCRWGCSLLSYLFWWWYEFSHINTIHGWLLSWSGHRGWYGNRVQACFIIELPIVRHDDEDTILCKLWWGDHDRMIEETCHLSRTGKYGIWLELGFIFLNHFYAEWCPGPCVDREDDEDLKRVDAFEGSLAEIPGGKETWELYESTALQLNVS